LKKAEIFLFLISEFQIFPAVADSAHK